MAARDPDCPACGRQMERGYMPDAAGGGAAQGHWVPGVPEWSWWHGLKLKGKRRLPVIAFRCPKCGRLELFAPDA